jgi:hypothetical protein
MGHCIQAIITTSGAADHLRTNYPQLPFVNASQEFVIVPVDSDFIDSVTKARPSQSTETFLLLTDAFHELLLDLSRFGMLAYVETDYFGGIGGQGAAVYSRGEVVMKPKWRKSGPVNQALKRIGVRRRLLEDRFSALRLGRYRSNDDLSDAAVSARRDHGVNLG